MSGASRVEPQVFICHSSIDAGIARAICDSLEASGIGCWIAPRDPISGAPYGRQIVNAIAASPVVVLVFSANANASRAVLNELELATNRGKPILPVRIEDVQPSSNLEFYLRATHWFDAISRPLEEALPHLVIDVRMLMASEDAATAPSHESLIGRDRDVAQVKALLDENRLGTPVGGGGAGNLPQQVTTLIGRDGVVSEIETLIRQFPLVTLVGTGGVGKTCVALRAGAELLHDFSDGIWFVELAPLNDGTLVAGALASVLGLMPGPSRSVLDTLLYYIKGKSLLMVLDNCEHLIEEVAQIAEAILRSCSGVRLLATSREPLRIAGEHIYRMPSLAVPPAEPARSIDTSAALEFDAIVLFAERARAADRKFSLNDDNASLVANICRRLDGIPLAIELAAARVNALPLNVIADGLDQRFQVLAAGSRTALPRQKTLRALIDWSYDLLSEPERALFRRLAVFAGGFTLDSAAAVGGGAEAVDLLASLVDKSLVQADLASDVRYRLLESMRVYAREKLVQHGELDAVSREHAGAYLRLAEVLEDAWETTPDTAWKARAEPELENYRAALRWAFSSDRDRDLGLRLAAALRPTWFTMAPSEGRGWIRAGLNSVGNSTCRPDCREARAVRCAPLHVRSAIRSCIARSGTRFEALFAARGPAGNRLRKHVCGSGARTAR